MQHFYDNVQNKRQKQSKILVHLFQRNYNAQNTGTKFSVSNFTNKTLELTENDTSDTYQVNPQIREDSPHLSYNQKQKYKQK